MNRREVELRIAARPALNDRDRRSTSAGRIAVRLGGLRCTAMRLRTGGSAPARLLIDAAGHDLALPPLLALNAVRAAPGEIRLGPLIGVLTSGHLERNRAAPRAPFGHQGYLLRNLAWTARQMRSFLFAFEPMGIDWARERIDGWTWAGNRWREVRAPLPDVVYNRVPNRRLEAQAAVQQAIAGLRGRGVPVFNPRFIDKWQLYECLQADESVSRYLPETKPLSGWQAVTDALARSPVVYLKPRCGSLGNGIVRLESTGRGALRVRYRWRCRNRSRLLPAAGAPQFIARLTASRDYVCQRGVELPLFRGRPFDVRILTQKDGSGQWRLTGMGVRVAGAGAITTHVPSGGSIAPLRPVLSAVFGDGAERVEADLRAAIAALAPAVERGLNEEFGELSMDLGVDRDGRIWFFEANSKPHKFDEDDIRLLSWRRTIEYAGYLSGFPRLGG